MVGDVENGKAYSAFILLPAEGNLQTLRHQHIQRKQLREPPATVARPNVVLSLIQHRKRKAAAPTRRPAWRRFFRESKVAPEQKRFGTSNACLPYSLVRITG